MIFHFVFLLAIFFNQSKLLGAGVWSESLCVDGLYDFSELHLSMARREIFLTERLVSGDEFERDADRRLIFGQNLVFHRKAMVYNGSGVPIFRTISDQSKKIFKDYKCKNVVVAYLCGITGSGTLLKVPIIKHYDYRVKDVKAGVEFVLTTSSRDMFLSRGHERSVFNNLQGDIEPANPEILTYSDMHTFEEREISRLVAADVETSDAMQDRFICGDHRVDSEQELLSFLSTRKNTGGDSVTDFFVFQQILEKLRQNTRNSNLKFVSLHLHNHFDSCPVCLYRLHHSFHKFENQVQIKFGNQCQFFIMNSSREDYIHQGVSRRSVGMRSRESTLLGKISRFEFEKIIRGKKIIQAVVNPFKAYANIHNLISLQDISEIDRHDVSEFFSRDINGWIPLHIAAQIQNTSLHRYLIDRIKHDSQHLVNGWHDAFLIRNNDYDTALHVAVNHKNISFLQTLLDEGFPWWIFSYLRGCKGNTLIHTAASIGDVDMLRYLIGLYPKYQNGHPFLFNTQTDESYTSLQLAQFNTRGREICDLLN